MVSYAKATEYPINNPFRSPKGEGWELRRIASEGSPFAKSPPMEQRGIRRRRIKKAPTPNFGVGATDGLLFLNWKPSTFLSFSFKFF